MNDDGVKGLAVILWTISGIFFVACLWNINPYLLGAIISYCFCKLMTYAFK